MEKHPLVLSEEHARARSRRTKCHENDTAEFLRTISAPIRLPRVGAFLHAVGSPAPATARRILPHVMDRRLRSATAGVILGLLLPLQLLSVLPAFHQHANELGRLFLPASGSAVTSSDASFPGSPNDCPACAASGLQAVAPLAAATVVPADRISCSARTIEAGLPSRPIVVSRGRAPPFVA